MNYKELITSIRQNIAEALRQRYGNKKADKYLQECAEFGKPKEESKNTKNTKPKEKNVIYIYDGDGNLINSFNNVYKCSRFILNKRQGVKPCYIGKIYKGYLLSYLELTQEEAREAYSEAEVINGRGKYKRGKK